MQKPYKTLLTTDCSEAVMYAERYAVQLAKNTNSVLSFLQVYDAPLPPPKITMSYQDVIENSRAFEPEKLTKHRDPCSNL